jgi:DNA (cytosine-5)-methyltransferase 1
MIKVIYYDIPEKVRIRKHKVNITEFQIFLKKHKRISNKKIAELLKINKSEVDHWFRTDNFFSIPSEVIWIELKKILKIDSNIYDDFVLEFEERNGVHDQSNRVYDINGIGPTITSTSADIRIIFKI